MSSKIASDVRTLVAGYSAPSSISFAYRKWETRLQKSEKLIAISVSLKAKIVLIFLWRPYFRKAGCLPEYNRGVSVIMLKGDIWSKYYLSMESGR